MIEVIANSNPRTAIREANELGLTKKDIIAVVKDSTSSQLLIIYEK